MRLMLRHSEVAIDIMTYCAQRPGSIVKTTDAAAFASTTGIFAYQVIGMLTRSGLLATVRGRSGGIRLAAGAEKTRIGTILRLVDPMSSSAGATPARKPLELLVVDAQEAAYLTLDRYSIEELAQGTATGRLACLGCTLRTHARSSRSPHDPTNPILRRGVSRRNRSGQVIS